MKGTKNHHLQVTTAATIKKMNWFKQCGIKANECEIGK